jgi:magnesium-transporting ATPase (P-type)
METSELEKKCQFCAENILIEAEVCKFCHRNQIDNKKTEEMINSLSIYKGLVGNIFFILTMSFFRWWLGLIFIALMIFSIQDKRKTLRNVSKLELLEKYEKHQKYLGGKIFLDIILHIVIILLILLFIGYYYSENSALLKKLIN